jgi:hypothetical protein
MPRTLSPQALQALTAEVTDEAFILLVKFSHPATSETYRVCLNTEPIFSNGFEFTPTYFEFALPETSDRAPQGCQISVDNVDRAMVDLLRQITTPLEVQIQMVLASQPDVVEMQLDDLILREVSWDVSRINGTLVSEDPLNQAFPCHLYEPRTFQGIF